jgi:hypothetical protein
MNRCTHKLVLLGLSSFAATVSSGCADPTAIPPTTAANTVPTRAPQVQSAGAVPAEQEPPAEQVPLAKDGPLDEKAPGALAGLADAISRAYESAKSQGLTAAGNAKDWLLDDIASSRRWEYRVVTATEQEPAALEKTLNELGREGWQCFFVQPRGTSLTFFMQRHPPSVSHNIPMGDLLKILPYLGLGQRDQ